MPNDKAHSISRIQVNGIYPDDNRDHCSETRRCQHHLTRTHIARAHDQHICLAKPPRPLLFGKDREGRRTWLRPTYHLASSLFKECCELIPQAVARDKDQALALHHRLL